MPLRCLVFSSNEEMVQPIWRVLADLGIEGEYCRSAVDAVEKVTTQLFQIVITDWDDQPEAAFLLKTARDQKAAQRPLTLAIVSDEARLPEALQAGANSVLLKPIQPDQVHDTMSTACELLRSKIPLSVRPSAAAKDLPVVPGQAPKAAAASIVSSSAASRPRHASEKTFRAGDFLQGSSAALSAQFETESEVHNSFEQAGESLGDALTELEPTASAVMDRPAMKTRAPREALTGWASLQSRLMKPEPADVAETPAKGDLLSYGETRSFGIPEENPATVPAHSVNESALNSGTQSKAGPEAALFSYMSGESKEPNAEEEAKPKRRGLLVLSLFAAVSMALVVAPQTRQSLGVLFRNSIRAGKQWLKPQPLPVAIAVPQHESFGQEGDEYKFPPAENIPDATTDPSQIRVVAVIDPTAKPLKSSEPVGVPVSPATSPSPEQNPAGPTEGDSTQASAKQDHENSATTAANTVVEPSAANSPSVPAPQQTQVTTKTSQPISFPVPNSATPNNIIPSSLRSQTASMTPDASGAKPVEAAMSSIEPVILPESAIWNLLAQPVDLIYPEPAKASGQRGSVVLQVLIGRDGTVQDAKFMQGSLVFARAAIDGLKQWRFKPYLMNGRPVSVQSQITVDFKPPS